MQAILTHLTHLLGEAGIVRAAADKAPYLREWRGRLEGDSTAVLLPKSTAEVAAVVRLCVQHGICLVPQGGNTGLVGGSVALKQQNSLLLSLKRLNRLRAVDAANFSLVAEAGCVLAAVQQAAAEAGRFFPLQLGSQGSATVGGLIATNAGGTMTLRYGNMRAQVLGLEVVLADGSIWHGLRGLRKNNSGYDLKQCFIGSEGTLGIITAACLTLVNPPRHPRTAILACASPQQALAVLGVLHADLAAFELMPQLAIQTATTHSTGHSTGHSPSCRNPFTTPYPWLALVETHNIALEPALATLLEKNLILDAVLAEDSVEAAQFWQLREAIVAAQKQLGASLKHDIAVPVSAIPAFLDAAARVVEETIPGARLYAFGHVGDGNIHCNISQPVAMCAAAFTAQREAMAMLLHDLALQHGGSISAEHGIGRFKREEFHRTVAPVELAMMRQVKQSLDPKGIFNPGVLF